MINEEFKRNLYAAKMEHTSLMQLVANELDKVIVLTTNRDWKNLSLMSNKLAIIYHKLDVAEQRLNELEEEFKNEIFKEME